MQPVLLILGSREIRSYPVLLGLAIVVGVAAFWYAGRAAGFPGTQLLIFCAGAVAFGLLGGRLNSWLFQLGSRFAWPNLNIASLRGGLTSFGSIIGALGFGAVVARRQGWSVWAFLDLAAPVIPLAEAIQRLGCLLNGCCWGRPTLGLLGVYLPDSAGHWATRYPTQVLTGLFCLALAVWLWRRRRSRFFAGELILSYLVMYHVGRLAIDALRGDERVLAGFLTTHQLSAAAVAALAAATTIYLGEQSKKI
jgi:phosphatidylglycerol:prolipoprotein diacylglycerol transferase